MKRFITCLALAGLLFAGNAFADANRAQYVPDIIVTEPGAVQTDIRAFANWAAAMDAIEASATPTTLIISQDTIVSATDNCPAYVTLKFVNGATITVSGGGKLTIYGPIEAGPYQIFDDSDGVATANYVVFASNPYIDKIYPQWWGASGADSPTIPYEDEDTPGYDTSAIQNAVYAAAANGGGHIYYMPGHYFIHDTIHANTNGIISATTYASRITHAGESYQTTILELVSTADTPVIQFLGSGSSYYCGINNMTIQRTSRTCASCFNDTVGSNSTCRNTVGIDVYRVDYFDIKNVMVYGMGYAYTDGTDETIDDTARVDYYKGNHRGLAVGIRINYSLYGTLTNSHVLYNSDIGILVIGTGLFVEENYIIENGLYCLEGGSFGADVGVGDVDGLYDCGDIWNNAAPDICPVYSDGPTGTNLLDASKQEIVPGGIVAATDASLYSCRDNEIFHNFIGAAAISGNEAAVSMGGGKIFENDIDSNLLSGVYIKQDGGNIIDGNFISNTGGYNGTARIVGNLDSVLNGETDDIVCASGEGAGRSDLRQFHWLGNSTCNGIYLANSDTAGDVTGTTIKNNFMYVINTNRTDYSTDYSLAPRGIYLGDNVTTVHVVGNYFDVGYLFIDAGNGTEHGRPSLVLQSNFFVNGLGSSIGVYTNSTNEYTALADLSNIFTESITTPIDGTVSLTNSYLPWLNRYTTLYMLDGSPAVAGKTAIMYFKDIDGDNNWEYYGYNNTLVAEFLNSAADGYFKVGNDNADHNVSFQTDGTLIGGAAAVIFEDDAATSVTSVMLDVVTTDSDGADLDTITLGDGTYTGQIKIINCAIIGNSGDTLAISANFIGSNTTLTFSPLAVGDGCILMWSGTDWLIIVNTNGTLS